MYREGKDRDVYALETTAQFLDFNLDPVKLKESVEQIAYIRGFFDAEGGIPRNLQSTFYIQLVQKNKIKIQKLKVMLAALNISTGLVHNPSVNIDPDYWRIFVSTKSHRLFTQTIGSWHPRKYAILRERMMI
jgi:intein/homing endonuclease